MSLPRDAHGQVRFVPPPGQRAWRPASEWTEADWTHWLRQQGWTDAAITQYLTVDRYRYGFGLQRHPREPWRWFYCPLPVAVPFHATKVPNVLFGGAAGGSKSYSARWDAYRHACALRGYVGLIMRRTYQELRRNHMRFVRREAHAINSWLGEEWFEWIPSEFELRIRPTDSVLVFGHCQNPGDEERYLSDEYDGFYPDELATFTREQVLGVASRLRSTVPGVRPRLAATSNPGGAHTLWVKRFFITHEVAPEEHERYRPEDWAYLPARLYDNPFLMDPDGTFRTYEDRLFARGELRRRQLLDGDWDAVVGQFFPELGPEHQADLAIPAGTVVDRALDWGYAQPGVCLWIATLPDGHAHVAHEYVFRQTLAYDVATRIREETLARGWIPGRTVADPSMFAGTGHGLGESLAETFQRAGVPLVEGVRERVPGWARLRHWLQRAPDGRPWLTIAPSCVYLLRTLPTLTTDDRVPEDADTSGDDHAADALRYWAMSRPAPPVAARRRTPDLPDSIRALLDQDAARAARPLGWIA